MISDYGNIWNPFKARYQGTVRDIPFEKLDKIEIKQFSMSRNIYIKDVTAQISTKTGIQFTAEYSYFNQLTVSILDELTGEKTDQRVWFGDKGKLNVRKIDFD